MAHWFLHTCQVELFADKCTQIFVEKTHDQPGKLSSVSLGKICPQTEHLTNFIERIHWCLFNSSEATKQLMRCLHGNVVFSFAVVRSVVEVNFIGAIVCADWVKLVSPLFWSTSTCLASLAEEVLIWHCLAWWGVCNSEVCRIRFRKQWGDRIFCELLAEDVPTHKGWVGFTIWAWGVTATGIFTNPLCKCTQPCLCTMGSFFTICLLFAGAGRIGKNRWMPGIIKEFADSLDWLGLK